MTENYPSWICEPCGRQHGRPGATRTSTWHVPDPNNARDVCGWCGSRTAPLCLPRDYGHPPRGGEPT